MSIPSTPVVLSIATSDSGAGAGIQADLKTFHTRNVYGVTALAALTAQNPSGVSHIETFSPTLLRAQLDQLLAYYSIQAAKTGMLFSAPLIREAARFFQQAKMPLVVDPVMVASSGAVLLQPKAVETLITELLPLATLVTPNLDEAAVLLGEEAPKSPKAMLQAGEELREKLGVSILLKGGHLESDELVDILFQCKTSEQSHLPDPLLLRAKRHPGVHTHGSGCTLSAAITAELARGHALPSAVRTAHTYLNKAIRNPLRIGGVHFIQH